MKAKITSLSALIMLLLALMACATTTPTNTQATIDAAVQGTHDAEQSAKATIDMAVQSTMAGVVQASTTSTPYPVMVIATVVQATVTGLPTPDYASVSQAELSALIDEAVTKATTDAQTAFTSTAVATSDGTVTTEEVTTTSEIAYQTYAEVAYANELIYAYQTYYGEYADAAFDTLTAMQSDLWGISESLQDIDAIMTQGAETASTAIDQLNAAASKMQTEVTEAQNKTEGWSEQVKNSISQRETDLLALQANQVEGDKIGALTQTHDFLDAFKGALIDGKFSPEELTQIGQLGANARASLLKTGDPQLTKFSGIIEDLTRNAARGEWGSARSSVGDFEKSLPARPSRK